MNFSPKTKCFWFSLLMIAGMVVSETYKVLAGKTGNGKSFISTLLGCPSQTGSGTAGTTKDAVICHDKLIIDSVGNDDDGKNYQVNYNGLEISLSGYSYPVYNLFEHLEKEKINSVEFFLIFDTNNMRLGGSSQFFIDFVTNDLQCSLTRVLNKYREENPDHKKNFQPGDQIVQEFAKTADIKGKPCSFVFSSDWRKKIIDQDLAAIRSMIKPENCDLLARRKKEYEAIRDKIPEDLLQTDCSYDRQTGSINLGGGWNVDIGLLSFGKKDKIQPIYEKAVNLDCQKLRVENNKAIEDANKRLHEEKMIWISEITNIEASLIECKNLTNWAPKEL